MDKERSSSTIVHQPTAYIHFGFARADITPPANIYHPMWGAARHHRATGVHRPLVGDVMVFRDQDGNAWAQAQLDMVGLGQDHHERLTAAIAKGIGIPRDQVVVAYSHTHAGGFFLPNRVEFPGGELILPYLEQLFTTMGETARTAAAALQPVIITFQYGRCNMARNRDFWDEENDLFACGFNPDTPADDTVLVARYSTEDGSPIATLVNYGCHPTTLAWENTLISPDYVGAMREVIETATGVPSIFTLGACGDLGPRQSHVGKLEVADANGRQLGYAVLSTLEGMDPPGMAFAYQGPVISGATLGTWKHVPLPPDVKKAARLTGGGAATVDLPQKPVPDADSLQQRMNDYLQKQRDADADGDEVAARNFGAYAERARRWLGRLPSLSHEDTHPYQYSVRRMGNSIWVALAGEPYNWIQTALRRRYPGVALVCTVVSSEMGLAYLLTKDSYGIGLYQEEPSSLDQGCLEELYDAVCEKIDALDIESLKEDE